MTMIVWQKAAWGTLVIAGLSIVGITIYQPGTDRKEVRAVDVLELVEGVLERQYALGSGPWGTTVTSNTIYRWTNDASGATYPKSYGTTVSNLPYLSFDPVGEALVQTNYVYGLAIPVTVKQQVGRFMVNGYAKYDITGFWDEAYTNWGFTIYDPNGEYSYAGRSGETMIFTNVAHGLVDTGVVFYYAGYVLVAHGTPGTPPYGYWTLDLVYFVLDPATEPPMEWTRGTVFWTYGQPEMSYATTWYNLSGWPGPAGPVTPVGAVDTNLILDTPAFVSESRKNAICANPSRAFMVSLDTAIKALVVSYVDTNNLTEFNGTWPMLTVTGLWARLQIGDGTNKFTREPSIDGDPITYGAYPWQIYTNDLVERQKVLHALTTITNHIQAWWTNAAGGESTWDGSLYFNPGTEQRFAFFLATNSGWYYFPPHVGLPDAPEWWRDATPYSGTFFTDEPTVSPLFPDGPTGTYSAVSGSHQPIHACNWEYQYSRIQRMFSEYQDAGWYSMKYATNFPATNGWTVTTWQLYTNATIEHAWESVAADLATTSAFPSALAYEPQPFVRNEARTSEYASTWTITGTWYRASVGAVNPVSNILQGASQQYSLLPGQLYSWNTNDVPATPGWNTTMSEYEMVSTNATLHYFGHRKSAGPNLLRFYFTRCTNSL